MKPAYRQGHPQPPPQQKPRTHPHNQPPPRGVVAPPTQPLPPVPASPELPPRRPELSDAAVVSRSWAMAFATLISRITGFAKVVLLAAILGAALASSFSVATQLPNLIAALVLEATFTAIFVPVLARAEQGDPDGGAAFVRRLVTLTTTLLLVATTVSVLAAPLLVRLMLGRNPQVNEPLTTAFAYLLLPQVLAYGLTSVFMAILNTRNVFGPTAWAPVVNNIVAITTLGVYLVVPGELSVDPVRMGNAKLLVLGIGTNLGVFAQVAVLLIALRRQHVSLRPLWGIDQRLKRFGAMAAAMVLYVLISQLGLVVGNQIASTAAASGPAIYNYTWLVLMLPFGIIGVTVLTVVTPRLSRNAAANDTKAVLADLSLATRLTLITLIPIAAFMTVGGPAIGSALFAYGHFGGVDAGYLGDAIALSAFTLIPYGLVLLQLRVFYAREQPWTPIVIILVITAVKVVGSVLAPHLTSDPRLVAGFLGLANGIGFLTGAIVGYILLRHTLRPAGGHLVGVHEVRTILVTIAASLLGGLVAHVADRLLGLRELTAHGGAAGSLLRLLALATIMLPIMATVMVRAQVPEAQAALGAVRRRIGRRGGGLSVAAVGPRKATGPEGSSQRGAVTYPEQRNSSPPGVNAVQEPIRRRPPERAPRARLAKGPEVTDRPLESAASSAASGSGAELPRPVADDFQPDIPAVEPGPSMARPSDQLNHGLSAEAARGPIPFDAPREPGGESSASPEDVHLLPGARIAGGRYRLLVFHGGTPPVQFWQALDTALDRQVALTFVDPDGALPDDALQEILSRTLRLSRIDKPGIARVLDVLHTGSGGLVVAEWIRGGSLQEVADTAPSPVGAVRAMQSLAAAADAAHRAGVALSIDHPSRVRVSIEGDVVLAYPATMPNANPQDDIRGIGAALYALLVNRWPLPESGVRSGLAPAELDSAGLPVEPTVIDRDIPFQISAVAVRAVQEDGGIRSASTLLNLLQQATAVADRTEVLGPIDDTPSLSTSRPTGREHANFTRRRRNVLIGVGAAVAVIVVALLVLASIVSKIFGGVGSGLNKDELGLNGPSSSTASSAASPAPSGSMVKPTKATVFSPDGDPDNPDQAGLAIDGNPATSWQSETYTDAVPFPSFKEGEGLMLQLPSPTVVGAVSIDTSSTGTKVEIRSASNSAPASLKDTKVLTPATALKPGHNVIKVSGAASTSNLLVWITTLGTTDGKSKAELAEITVQAAS